MSVVNVLAIDTATEQCSVALSRGTQCIERCVQTPRGHAELVLPMVQELMAEAGLNFTQLNAIAFGRGPGAFTGVRIAIGVAQGLAFAADLPLLPVSDLAAVAQQATVPAGARILVCMDARMGEVYTGLFSMGADGLVDSHGDEQVCPPERVTVPANDLTLGLGTGFHAYQTLRERYGVLTLDDHALPRARDIARLGVRDWRAGRAVRAELAALVYLRDQVVHVKT